MSDAYECQLIDSILSDFRSRNRVPAVGASIVRSDGTATTRVAGVPRRGARNPVVVSDKWHIGSCTKSVTAALWARLVELAYAKWDTPLPEIFEDLRFMKSPWANVTIHHVLQCRAGFTPNVRRDVLESSWKDTRPLPEQRSDIVEQALQRKPVRVGTFKYSNLSYIVLGAAIDRVAQQSFEDALERHLFQPLGIHTAGFGAPETIYGHRPRVSLRGTGVFRGPPASPKYPKSDNPLVYSSAGCLHLSLPEWSSLMRVFLVGSSEDLLGEESLKTIFDRPVKSAGSMAVGWMQPLQGMGIPYFMQGSNTLWSATAFLALDRERCALVVCNDGRSQVLRQSVSLASLLLAL